MKPVEVSEIKPGDVFCRKGDEGNARNWITAATVQWQPGSCRAKSHINGGCWDWCTPLMLVTRMGKRRDRVDWVSTRDCMAIMGVERS